ncbi:unnamed protein product [Cuscuta epithymum]|uniref:Bromodomain associated domain-containing protein n=1 Tax=Cuscuta epithymum TaxID=186058 RepID=A0AAV0EDG7_9ASTE|nr:unnamed protein product [Cuscuta epithymum]
MISRDKSSSTAAQPQSESNYASSISKIAVAQICESAGYAAAEASALAVLTDIAGLYLKAIAKSAASSANSRGRTESNLLDVTAALEELGSVQGFAGASSTARNSVLNSPMIRELEKFVEYTEETPFAQPLPPRKAMSGRKTKQPKRGNLLLRDSREYNEGRFKHVPRWLPSMPEIEKDGKGDEKLGFGPRIESESERQPENNNAGKQREKGNGLLATNRTRVRFKLSTRRKSPCTKNGGVCRGGIGKRVSCENHRDDARNRKKTNESFEKSKSLINSKKIKLGHHSLRHVL